MAPYGLDEQSEELGATVDVALRCLDHIATPVLYLDADLTVRYANRAASDARLMWPSAPSASPAPSAPDAASDAAHAPDPAPEHELVRTARAALASGHESSAIAPFPAKSRRRSRQHLVSFRPDIAEDGAVAGLFCEAVDITDLLGSEKSAREAETRLRHILESAPLVVTVKDPAGRYVLANRRFEQAVGVKAEELVGRTDAQVLPADVAEFMSLNDDLVLSDGIERCARKHLAVGGEERVFLCRKSALLDDDGRIRGICGIATDITESERARERMTESEARVHGLLDSISDAFFALDHDWRFSWVNARAARVLGRGREELLGEDIRQAFADQAGTSFQAEFERAFETGEDITFEAFFEPTRIWVEVRVYPSPSGVSAFFTDVTERRREAEERDGLLHAYQEEMLRNLLLKEIASAAARSTSLEQATQRALAAVRRRLGASVGSVYHLAEDRMLHRVAMIGFPPEADDQMLLLPVDDSTDMGRVALHRLPHLTHESPHHARASQQLLRTLKAGGQRHIILPIQRGEDVVGTFGLMFEGRRSFRPDELALFAGIAEQLAITIENARLSSAQARALERADAELATSRLLLEASRMLASSLEVRDVLGALIEILGTAIGRSRILLRLSEETDELFELEGIASPVRPTFRRDEFSPSIRESLERGESVVVDLDSLTGEARRMAEEHEFLLGLIQPLIVDDRLFGLLSIHEPGRRVPFTARDRSVVSGIAAQASIALENARLYEEQRRQAALREAVARIDLIVHSTLDIGEVMEQVVHEARVAMGCESASVMERHDESWVVRYADGFDPDIAGVTLHDEDMPHGVLASRTRETLAIDDAEHDDRVDPAVLGDFGIKAVVVSPLLARGDVTGLLFVNRDRPHRFTPAEVDFASRVAASISLALENARLYAAEHRVAETLQRSMLSVPSRVRGVEFGHFYHSATEHARVGGDFYDVFELDGTRVALIIGDVSGKGLDASYLTALVKNALRSHAVEGSLPSVVMRKTNETVRHFSSPEVFVTVFFGILDTAVGTLTYCCAGHPSPMLVHEGEVVLLHAKDPICGAFAGLTYRDHVTRLAPGDLLVMYTDGITEARDTGALYGESRLAAFLASVGEVSAGDVAEELFHEIWAYSNGSLRDDVAMLCARLAEHRRAATGKSLAEQASLPV